MWLSSSAVSSSRSPSFPNRISSPASAGLLARADAPLGDDGQRVVFRRERERKLAAFRQAHVQHRDRREGVGRTARVFVRAGDDPDLAATGQRHARNVGRGDRLVGGCRRLVLGGQVHPELHHVHAATGAGELGLVVLLVEDAAPGGHPLDVARTDHAGVPGVVLVSDRALPGQGDRLEPAVGMPADAALAACQRRELLRRTVVHQHERAHSLGRQALRSESTSTHGSRCRPSGRSCCGERSRRCGARRSPLRSRWWAARCGLRPEFS